MSKIKKNESQPVPIGQLANDAIAHLRERGLSESTLSSLRNLWLQLETFMSERGYVLYDSQVGEAFLAEKLKDAGVKFSDKWALRIESSINRLTEFWKTGTIARKERLSPSFESEIGKSVLDFLAEKKASGRFSQYTVEHDRYYLSVFVDYTNKHSMVHMSDINIGSINSFLDALPREKKSLRHHVIRELRLYLRYLHGLNPSGIDLSRLLPHDAYRHTYKIPSVYSKEEIIRLCNSIERSGGLGKRDYAIIMLLSRYGLRASDICGLCLDNILWDRCVIILTQYKTKEKIELPLVKDVGEAIIDYLRYGRPKSDDRHVFLCGNSPFNPLNPERVYGIISDAFHAAHIDTSGRKHGPHALRHSLATLLLKEGVVLPVITGILGHKDSGSTRDYLRLDMESLRQCAIEVPPVSCGFYNQNGGAFYE